MCQDVMKYESTIWSTCDILRGVSVSQHKYPHFMMPFLAIAMLESRVVREIARLEEEMDREDIPDEMEDLGKGFNQKVFEGTRLSDICATDSRFEESFDDYLQAWDSETKELLGIGRKGFMGLQGVIEELSSKKILFAFAQKWSEVDLVDFDNSAITTLEEHIKRKWSDWTSASDGQYYTPFDVIELIQEIATNMAAEHKNMLNVYDMTCGGGNLVYGVQDLMHRKQPETTVNAYGQEYNDALYALAAIESRFRTLDDEIGNIQYGCTLTNDKFPGRRFDCIVANPPYGVDWKNKKRDIENDQTGRYFEKNISVSDGQLLFMQHAVAKLEEDGYGIIVHNGSPMFTGDVNSGESRVRKQLLENDWVEAWVQLPKGEFFDTQITTYLWIINKDKPAERKDKIMLINADKQFKKLKKSMGQKTNYMDGDNIAWVTDALKNFEANGDDIKICSKFDFYYNKQQLTLIEKSESGKSLYQALDSNEKAKGVRKITKPLTLRMLDKDGVEFLVRTIDGVEIETIRHGDKEIYDILNDDVELKGVLDEAKSAMPADLTQVKVHTLDSKFLCDHKDYIPTLLVDDVELGAGRIVPKIAIAKARGKEYLKLTCELKAELTKDYEIIPYQDGEANEQAIQDFLGQWVRKDYILGDNSVGVEVNFNKIFYKPVVLRSTTEIAADIKNIDAELAQLEKELWG